jgi:hypothetical protein
MSSNIIYKSDLNKNTVKPNQLISTLNTIVTNCNKKNARIKISGLLIFYKNQFYQWIEGEQEPVDALFDQIIMDNRHSKVTIMKHNFQDFKMFEPHPMKLICSSGVADQLTLDPKVFEARSDEELEEISRNPSDIIPNFSKFQ